MQVGDKVLYRGDEMTISWVGRELATAVDADERPVTANQSRFKPVPTRKPKDFVPSPETVTKFTDDPQYNDFFQMLAAEASIRVQARPEHMEIFKINYFNATGVEADTQMHDIAAQKWGASISVTFPKKFSGLVPLGLVIWPAGINPEGRQEFTNKEVAWEMFSKGFRLGSTHSYTGVGGESWPGLKQKV